MPGADSALRISEVVLLIIPLKAAKLRVKLTGETPSGTSAGSPLQYTSRINLTRVSIAFLSGSLRRGRQAEFGQPRVLGLWVMLAFILPRQVSPCPTSPWCCSFGGVDSGPVR